MSVQGAEDISAGPVWCYPRDQSQLLDIGHRRESPSVTTTLFTLYLRILLYNKFDVAKPSDHITTIKLIPLSYSGGPTQCHRGQTIIWLKLGEKLGSYSSAFLSNIYCWLDSSQCFCFRLTWSEFADFYNARVNGTLHCPIPLNISHQAGICLSDFQQLSSKLYDSFNKKIDCCRLLWGVPLIRAQYIPIILLQ